MKVANINGALPQKVEKKNIAETFEQSVINKLSSVKERTLAKTIIDTVFKKIDDYSEYTEKLNVKQIDLILGRIESLLEDELKKYNQSEKNNVKDAISESSSNNNSKLINKILKSTLKLLKTPINKLKTDIKTIVDKRKERDDVFEDFNNRVKKEIESRKENKKEDKKDDTEEKNKNETSDVHEQSETNTETQNEEIKETQNIKNTKENTSSDKSIFMDSIKEELKKLELNIEIFITDKFLGSRYLRQKREIKKQEEKLFSILDTLSDNLKIITNFFKTFGKKVLKFIEKNIYKLSEILSKALKILFKPIIGLFWATIGPILGLIAAGIFLILKAVSENLPAMKEPIIRLMEVLGESVKILASTAPEVVKLFNSIVDFSKYLINFIVKDIWPFIKDELWPFIKDELWPFIKDEIWTPFLKPLCIWIRDKFGPWINDYILPVLGDILTWIKDKFIPWINDHIMPIFSALLDSLKVIIDAIMPWLKILVDVIFQTLMDILNPIEAVSKKLGDFFANIFIDLINGIQRLWDDLKRGTEEIWNFLTKTIPNFGSWLWTKIKEMLPFGNKEPKDAVAEYESKVMDNWDLNKFREENDKLRKRIKELSNWEDTNKLIKEKREELDDERSTIIKIDKGTIFDLVKLINQMDSYIREILGKTVKLLENLVDYLNSNDLNNINQKEQTEKDLKISSEITSQLNSNNSIQIEKLNVNSTKIVNDVEIATQTLNENNKQIIENRQKQKKSNIQSIKDFLSENFEKVFMKLEEPIEVPMPIFANGVNPKNQASMENI